MTQRGTIQQQKREHVTGLDPFTVPVATHPLAKAPVRARVVVEGTVGPIRTVAWAGGPVTELTLVDDTDVMTLAFFGAGRAAGVHTGSHLVAAGTVVDHHGRRIIMSPQLWLAPAAAAVPAAGAVPAGASGSGFGAAAADADVLVPALTAAV
jgi:hypothetical protein